VISDTLHGTQTPLPRSNVWVDILAVIGRPLLWTLDLLLRFIIAPIMMWWVIG
jgi:hypothetical protein